MIINMVMVMVMVLVPCHFNIFRSILVTEAIAIVDASPRLSNTLGTFSLSQKDRDMQRNLMHGLHILLWLGGMLSVVTLAISEYEWKRGMVSRQGDRKGAINYRRTATQSDGKGETNYRRTGAPTNMTVTIIAATININDTLFDSMMSSNGSLGDDEPIQADRTDVHSDIHGYIQSIIIGMSCTVLLFVAFMPFAGTWDKHITKRLSGRTIYIAQHFDQDQSSHLSEIILRNNSSQLSENIVTSRSHESDESSEVSLM